MTGTPQEPGEGLGGPAPADTRVQNCETGVPWCKPLGVWYVSWRPALRGSAPRCCVNSRSSLPLRPGPRFLVGECFRASSMCGGPPLHTGLCQRIRESVFLKAERRVGGDENQGSSCQVWWCHVPVRNKPSWEDRARQTGRGRGLGRLSSEGDPKRRPQEPAWVTSTRGVCPHRLAH